MQKIPGPALCGFADVFEDDGFYRRDDGEALVGAKAHKAPKGSAHAAPPVPKPYPKAKQSSTVANHAKVLAHARQVLAHAKGQVRTAARRTLAKPAVPKQRVAGPYVTVHGDDYVIVGAAAVPPRQQPKVKAALAKLQAAKDKAKKAAAEATKKTKAAGATMYKLAAQVKHHESVARQLSGKGSHSVHGYLDGAGVHGDAAGLNPGDPGYDPTTDPASAQYVDPNAGAAPDGSGGTSSAQLDIDTLVAAANAAGTVPMDQPIDDFTKYPAIKYDGSKGAPDGYVLSYGLAMRDTDIRCEPDTVAIDGTAHFGFCWKTYPKRVGGIPWGEDMGDQGWNHLHGRHWFSEGGWSEPCSPEQAYASYKTTIDISLPGARVHGYSMAASNPPRSSSYGPLIGNPAMADFKNMRVDFNGVMFWIASEAPDWVTWPLKAQAALTKAAADKAKKDADAAAAAAAAKAAADAAAAKAAQDAQNALDEANAASQARQQASQAQGQSAQAQAEADAADAQAARDEQAQAQAQYQQDLADQQWQSQQAQQQAAQDLAERKWQFEQAQLQARQDAAAAQAAQQQQYQPPDDGGGDGGAPPADDVDPNLDPEAASDAEAAQIDADADVLGRVLGQPQILGDDAVIGGDGEPINLDNWGNALD